MKRALWLRLKRYHFDNLVPAHLVDRVTAAFGGADASTHAFAAKLARKIGWTTAFALEAIDEYKKFVYLGVVADFSVTPPKVIDQVWHEHLLFSRAYREFCHDVLGKDFDHNPELVPTSEQTDVFNAQYKATLDLYATEFNVSPPYQFWRTPKFNLSTNPQPKQPLKKKKRESSSSSSIDDHTPLYLLFDDSYGDGGPSYHHLPEFGGGGGFLGGGGGHSWSDSTSHDSHSDGGGHSSDSGSSHGGGDGGGGSCSGGSGCSSSCGGGGCGGGD